MPYGVDELLILTGEETADWRRHVPEGHTREVGPAAARPGGRADPDEPLTPLGPGDLIAGDTAFLKVPSRDPRRLSEREAVHAYADHLLRFARDNRAWFLGRARQLRATSPLQFSHLTDDQLSGQLVGMIEAKARAAVERTYLKLGWSKPLDMDLVASGSPLPLFLPGQRGR